MKSLSTFGVMNRKRQIWEVVLNKEINIDDFHRSFSDINAITNIPKLRSFQYRIQQRAIVTNSLLYEWNSLKCTHCGKETETVVHLVVECDVAKIFWIKVESFMKEYSSEPIHFGYNTVLFSRLIPKVGRIKNFICLLGKYYIYRQRCMLKEVNFVEFKNMVYNHQKIEKYYATKHGKLHTYLRKWFGIKASKEKTIVDYIQQYMTEVNCN